MVSLPSEAIVVRFGEVMRVYDLACAAAKHALRYDMEQYAISVFVTPGSSPEETAARACRPNKRFCFTTVATVLQAGFTFSGENPSNGHTDIILPTPPSSDDLATLAECFTGTGVNPNPVRGTTT